MKILYSIQGTGNGHISRAREIIPLLREKCQVDILISGYQCDLDLPFEVKYKYHGLSFIFGNKGGVDFWKTFVKADLKKLFREIISLPIEQYDFVINDFEPVSAWACLYRNVPCISLSHQSAVLHKKGPKPASFGFFGRFILKNYAPSKKRYGFHFSNYDENVFTPVIRAEIRQAEKTDKNHYTVYLPSYDEEKIIQILSELPEVHWQVFSKKSKEYRKVLNVEIFPITNTSFVQSMVSCSGVICGAGFETPAEALYLGKKLLVIPMKNQYEQQCNAMALKSLGVPVIKKLKRRHLSFIKNWVDSEANIEVEYPDETKEVIDGIFIHYVQDLIDQLKDISYSKEIILGENA